MAPFAKPWRGAPAAATYLSLAFRVMRDCNADRIRTRAARQDDSAVVILVLVLLAMFSSFAAIFGLIGAAKGASKEGKLFFVGLAAATIFISWLVTQVVFTLHYAHEYLRAARFPDKNAPGALTFPGDARRTIGISFILRRRSERPRRRRTS